MLVKIPPIREASIPSPDHVSNIDFISHAFINLGADEAPWVTGFPGDPNSVDHAMWGGRCALPLPGFINSNHNNFVAVSSFKRGNDGRYHRRKADFSAMHTVMIDDIGTKIAHSKVALSPSCLVETSPGNFQAWYFLSEPECNRLKAETLIKGMIASGLTADGADPGMNGVTRYGRLPVGINGKAKYVERLGHPFVQRVAAWSPQCRYSIDDIASAYGVNMTVMTKYASVGKARPKIPAIPGTGLLTDGYLNLLSNAGLYVEPISSLSSGHRIICPWVHEHTDRESSGTVYFEPSEQNDGSGGFKCHHGHCQGRTIADLTNFLIRLQKLSAGATA